MATYVDEEERRRKRQNGEWTPEEIERVTGLTADEDKAQAAFDAANAASAQNVAAQAGAASTAATSGVGAGASMISGGSVQPQQQTAQQKAQNQAAINAAVAQNAPSAGKAPDADTQYMQGIHNAYEERTKLFSDYINEVRERQKQEEEEMRRQEKADMWSTMGTGATELAAGIINMLGVGELHASNQQYHTYSHDWMQKADQNIREHRKRREGMRDTLDRLNMQMQELKSAQSLQELQTLRQIQKEKEAKERQERDDAFRREQFEWQKEKYEQDAERQAAAMERQNKATEASIAQGWAKINESKENYKTQMLANGWVPDENAPGKFRFDPEEAKKWGVTLSGDKKGKELSIPLLAYKENGVDLPAETLTVQDEATLKNIIFTNIDAVSDLSEADKNAITNLLEDESIDADKKASSLRRYLVKSGQLRSLLRGKDIQDNSAGWLFRQYEYPKAPAGGGR